MEELSTPEEILTPEEVRVLGALIEKESATPAYYPMTLNALTAACNQRSNRDPVVDYSDDFVLETLDGLRERGLTTKISGDGGRTPKNRQNFTLRLKLSAPEIAALCVLMLRGPRTPGEIRGRAERLYEFQSLDEVEQTLNGLARRAERPLVVALPRRPGQKERRYAHLLAGPPVELEDEPEAATAATPAPRVAERVAQLEDETRRLRQELDELKQAFAQFKSQFD